MMPEMDGLETTRHIRELNTEYAKSIPIIGLTANVLPENEELFLSNGFNAYMTKPISIKALNVILEKFVRVREKEKLYSAVTEEEETQSGNLSAFSIEGIDLAAGAIQFGGEKNYLEIVKVFVSDTPKLLKDIQKCLDGFRIMPGAAAAALESLKNYTITVHGIKGSCYGICATQVGDLARELETAAKAQDLGKIMELNNQFINLAEKLVDELKILFPKKEEKAKLEKKAPDPAVLQKLLNAAQSYNINIMFEVMDELEQFRYSADDDLVSQLRQATENYDYTEVIELINSVFNTEEDNSNYTLDISAN
jgi:CheY-like chemotaxis protein